MDLEALKNIRRLKELYLAHNYLDCNQFEQLAYLNDLEVLDISHNHLKEQRVIDIIESLNKLRIFINNMNDYTQIIFSHASTSLQQLYLEGNNLSVLEFQRPKISLRMLSVKNNHLSEIIGLNNLESLEQLNTNCNTQTDLDSVRELNSLRILYSENNGLLSYEPMYMTNIEILNLSANKLTHMEFMACCPNIRSLMVSSNKIENLPGFDGVFFNLMLLDLS